MLVRAGCDVNWINAKNASHGVKSCELISIHRSTRISFAVEAKSKHRNGILNQKGAFDSKAEHQGVSDLLKSAVKKNSQNLPLVIFIDLNLPFYSNESDKRNPIRQIEEAVKSIQKLFSAGHQLSLIAFTNFPFHYGKPESVPPLTEHCFAQCADGSFQEEIKKDIENSLLNYGHIPREI